MPAAAAASVPSAAAATSSSRSSGGEAGLSVMEFHLGLRLVSRLLRSAVHVISLQQSADAQLAALAALGPAMAHCAASALRRFTANWRQPQQARHSAQQEQGLQQPAVHQMLRQVLSWDAQLVVSAVEYLHYALAFYSRRYMTLQQAALVQPQLQQLLGSPHELPAA